MNITSIITEYNPFHNGHKYHLEEAIKQTNCDATICIMSGNFVQRGEPSLIDKWTKTEMALKNGVDLIIELPSIYAISSAEYFAHGAISILNSLGVVNNVFFGSECGDVDKLYNIANILTKEPIEFKNYLKEYLSLGEPFFIARQKALMKYSNDNSVSEVISCSNNILGIEYIKSLIKNNSNIKPYTLKRVGSNYNDKELSTIFSSATSIREILKTSKNFNELKESMPNESIHLLNNLYNNDYKFTFDYMMFPYIKYKLLTKCANFNNLPEIIEGLDNKLLNEIISSSDYTEFLLKVKSKRYTYTKISRILTQLFIGFDNYDLKSLYSDNSQNYVRVLGFNNKGRKILSLIKSNSCIPIITNISKNNCNTLLDIDILSTKAYSILNPKINPNNDYLQKPIIIH